MTDIAQHLLDALSLGSLYSLLGLGIALVFGIMRLVNFAHGELVMVGAFAAVTLGDAPWPVVVIVIVCVPVAFALVMERIAFRPVRGAHETTLLVTSFAVSYLLQNVALLAYGATPKSINLSSLLAESFTFAGLTTAKLNVATVLVTAVLLVGLSLFLSRTTLGVQMRASAEDFTMARVLGVRANRVIAAAFAISGLLAGVASYLIVAQNGAVYPSMGLNAILVAFIATVLGGLGSLPGAVVGGMTLAVLSVALDAYLPPELREFRDAFAYAAVIGVLVWRPQGLIVPKTARTRV